MRLVVQFLYWKKPYEKTSYEIIKSSTKNLPKNSQVFSARFVVKPEGGGGSAAMYILLFSLNQWGNENLVEVET